MITVKQIGKKNERVLFFTYSERIQKERGIILFSRKSIQSGNFERDFDMDEIKIFSQEHVPICINIVLTFREYVPSSPKLSHVIKGVPYSSTDPCTYTYCNS